MNNLLFCMRHPVRSFVRWYLRAQRDKLLDEAICIWMTPDDGTLSHAYFELSRALGFAEQILGWDGKGQVPARVSEEIRDDPDTGKGGGGGVP